VTGDTNNSKLSRAVRTLTGARFSAVVVLLLVLGVFGGAIFQGFRGLQRAVREQMINHDGEVLFAVAQKQSFVQPATNAPPRLDQEGDQFNLLLRLSELADGCLGVRLYDARGKPIIASPLYLTQPVLDSPALLALNAGRQISRYQPAVRMSDLSIIGSSNQINPVLEVNIPVRAPGQSQLLACAQLLIDGHELQEKFANVDQRLRWQAWTLFIAGGTFLACALGWGYWRLQKANRLLEDRTARLLRANHELTLAAKTSALGAVTAHLIHGLSNPLANLHDLAAAHQDEQDGQWQEAIAATRRMQQLVHEVVRVLSESKDSEYYEVTLEELTKLLLIKVRPLAESFGVQIALDLRAQGQLVSHHANIIQLILENLVHNAVQVTPRGRMVSVCMTEAVGEVICQVADQGNGIAEPVLKHLFTPCRSTKGGSGLGLAISQQLAHQLGAKLELKGNGARGATFALILPRAVCAGPNTQPSTLDSDASRKGRKGRKGFVIIQAGTPRRDVRGLSGNLPTRTPRRGVPT
jgi:signal transduction histidine kinase